MAHVGYRGRTDREIRTDLKGPLEECPTCHGEGFIPMGAHEMCDVWQECPDCEHGYQEGKPWHILTSRIGVQGPYLLCPQCATSVLYGPRLPRCGPAQPPTPGEGLALECTIVPRPKGMGPIACDRCYRTF